MKKALKVNNLIYFLAFLIEGALPCFSCDLSFNITKLHQAELKGEYAKIAVVEFGGCHENHPAFSEFIGTGQINTLFFSNHNEIKSAIISGTSKNKDFNEYFRSIFQRINEKDVVNNSHTSAVVGVIKTSLLSPYPGVSPAASIIIYQRSECTPCGYKFRGKGEGEGAGLAVYTIDDYFKYSNYFHPPYNEQPGSLYGDKEYEILKIKQSFLEETPELLETPLNDNILRIIKDAAEKECHCINFSSYLSTLLDPYVDINITDFLETKEAENHGSLISENYWRIPEKILDNLESILEGSNLILVLSANNDSLDLTLAGQRTKSLGFKKNAYFLSLAHRPKIACRLIIAGNIARESRLLHETSNYPGQDRKIQEAFMCAPGTMIFLPTAENRFASNTGTSFSAPYLAGIIGLMQDHSYKIYGKYLPAEAVVKRMRDTAYPWGDQTKYGRGIVDIRKLFPDIFNEGGHS